MPSLDNLRRVTYGPHIGTYEAHEGWTGRFYTVTKDTENGTWITEIYEGRNANGTHIGTRITDTLTAADRYITAQAKPLRDKARAEQQEAQRRHQEKVAAQKAREKAERLSVNSHLDSDVWIKAKITREEAIALAAGLLYWADSNRKNNEDIDLNIRFSDDTRAGNWRVGADDARMEITVGWSGRGEINPLIVDSYIGKRAKAADEVAEDENIGVAV